MNRTLLGLIFVLPLLGCLSGCAGKVINPTPDETIVGSATGSRPNWVVPGDYSDYGSSHGTDLGGLTLRDVDATQGDRIEGIVPAVYFDYDQYFVRPNERAKINQAAEHLLANPSDNLVLEGRCDHRGTTEYNLALGDRRANSVMKYLIQLGVDGERISTLSRGDLDATEGASEEQMQQDRRADFVIVRR